MVLITDKFHKASNGTRAEATTLTAQKALGASTISTAALNGWPTDTVVDFQIYNTNTQGAIVAGSQSDWRGIVSGTTITQLQLTGGSDTVYPIGAIVVALPTANWANSLVDGILTSLDQDGTIKANGVDNTAALADSIVTSAKIADGTIVTTKLADNAVTGAKISSYKVQAQADTVNSTQSSAKIYTGWGQILGTNASSITEIVTLPAAVGGILSATSTSLGFKTGGTVAANITEFDSEIATAFGIQITDITTTSFRVTLTSTGTFGPAYHGYSWTLIVT